MPNKRHGTPGYVPAGDLSTCIPKVLFNRQGLLKKFRSNNKLALFSIAPFCQQLSFEPEHFIDRLIKDLRDS